MWMWEWGMVGLRKICSDFFLPPSSHPLPMFPLAKPNQVTTISNGHKLGGLQWQKFILPQFSRLKIQTQGVRRATSPAKAPGENLSLPLLDSSIPRHSLACGCLVPMSHIVFSRPSLSHLSSPFPSLIRILVLGFKAQLGNPGWFPLKILVWITSTKTLSPNKVTFTESVYRTCHFGGHHSPNYRAHSFRE